MKHYMHPLLASHLQQAARCYNEARYADTIHHYLACLKLGATQHHYIYADLAKAYEMLGKWDAALACLETARRLCPESETALRREARIRDQKTCYDTLIGSADIGEPPPQKFLDTLKAAPPTFPKTIRTSELFTLTYHSETPTDTLWNICHLIQRTASELGAFLKVYPNAQVAISIANTAASGGTLPNWASGCYDGGIHLEYCGTPVLSILYALLRHEWVHLLVHQQTGGRCPVWLDEGLAQSLARPTFNSERRDLRSAVHGTCLLPFTALSQPFAELPTTYRRLAYLQSRAIVEFCIQRFGTDRIRKLLHVLSHGTPTETAVEQVFGCRLADIPLAGTY